jgi:2-desacetyl-2-hydroxyethyl bacteriochlorophyllide A dehydrogenase
MQAAIITAPHTVEIAEVPDPTPDTGEVVIEVAASGICGTDKEIFDGAYRASLPVIPGHEFSGTVVAVGAQVHGLRVGDRVAADPNRPCQRCRYCHDGRVNLCDNYAAYGVTMNGATAQYLSVPEHLCVVLPETLDLHHAALIEPLSCALHAWDLVGTQAGKRAVIYGSGTMGLMMLQLAGAFGIAGVDMIDVNPLKLEAAWDLGATSTVTNAAEAMPDRGWDLVIDATGAAGAIADGLGRIAKGGTFLQFGVAAHDDKVEISPYLVYEHELKIIGAVCPLNSFARSADLLSNGTINPVPLISDKFAVTDYEEALLKFSSGQSRKVLVVPAANEPHADNRYGSSASPASGPES